MFMDDLNVVEGRYKDTQVEVEEKGGFLGSREQSWERTDLPDGLRNGWRGRGGAGRIAETAWEKYKNRSQTTNKSLEEGSFYPA